jgi:2-polyprenyl-6-methoxyphenol hydroxylase-like FAD-dependent oxidoreductase
MTSTTTDVLISGAGAAGLTLAIELARRGIAFRLIDQLEAPFHGSRGKGIQPRTQELFEDLGIVDRLFAIGGLYPPARRYQPDGSHTDTAIIQGGPATPGEPYQQPLMVPQFLTEQVMRERLAALGHAPEFGLALVSFKQDSDGVTAHITTSHQEETIRARYLIGADGGRSLVRNTLGIDFPGKTLGMRAVVADVVLTGLPRDAWHHFNESSNLQRLSVCPLAGTDWFQVQAPVPLEGEVDVSAAGLQTMVRERSGRQDLCISEVSWASAYQMNARLADRYRDGRVFLAGDAAHTHPPTGGQGLNTSVQDAYNLGWKLAAVLRGAPDALLDTYEEERRPIAAEMLGLSTRLLDNAKRGDFSRGRDVQQLDLGYAGRSLALEIPQRHDGLRAGDRAPDAVLLGAAGQQRRLFDLFAGTHWTLLGYRVAQGQMPVPAGVQVHRIGPHDDLIDAHGQFAQAYSPALGDWILIRPDGYIAAWLQAGPAQNGVRFTSLLALAVAHNGVRFTS